MRWSSSLVRSFLYLQRTLNRFSLRAGSSYGLVQHISMHWAHLQKLGQKFLLLLFHPCSQCNHKPSPIFTYSLNDHYRQTQRELVFDPKGQQSFLTLLVPSNSQECKNHLHFYTFMTVLLKLPMLITMQYNFLVGRNNKNLRSKPRPYLNAPNPVLPFELLAIFQPVDGRGWVSTRRTSEANGVGGGNCQQLLLHLIWPGPEGDTWERKNQAEQAPFCSRGYQLVSRCIWGVFGMCRLTVKLLPAVFKINDTEMLSS